VKKTVYLSLVTLGVASIATAAVMTNEPTEPTAGRRIQAQSASTATHHTRAVASETEKNGETKRECRHHCPFSDD
jgi:hypothetical protein